MNVIPTKVFPVHFSLCIAKSSLFTKHSKEEKQIIALSSHFLNIKTIMKCQNLGSKYASENNFKHVKKHILSMYNSNNNVHSNQFKNFNSICGPK